MKSLVFMAGLALMAGRASAANLWQECQIETVTLCGPEGCRNVQPTLKLYFGDYAEFEGPTEGVLQTLPSWGPLRHNREPVDRPKWQIPGVRRTGAWPDRARRSGR